MRKPTSQTGNSSTPQGSSRQPQTGVTPENWTSKALAFMGGEDGFVIRAVEGERGEIFSKQPATDAQWIAWGKWFDRKHIPVNFIRSFGCATVPCEWPEMFDGDMLMSSDRFATLERRPLAVQQAGRRLPDWLRPKDLVEAGRVSRPRPPMAEALSTLDRLRSDYAARPAAPLGSWSAPASEPASEDWPIAEADDGR